MTSGTPAHTRIHWISSPWILGLTLTAALALMFAAAVDSG